MRVFRNGWGALCVPCTIGALPSAQSWTWNDFFCGDKTFCIESKTQKHAMQYSKNTRTIRRCTEGCTFSVEKVQSSVNNSVGKVRSRWKSHFFNVFRRINHTFIKKIVRLDWILEISLKLAVLRFFGGKCFRELKKNCKICKNNL